MIHVFVSVQMEAPASRVYDLVRDAYRMDTWHPGIPRCERDVELPVDVGSGASARPLALRLP